MKVVNELTCAALKLQKELLSLETRNNTREFVDIPLNISYLQILETERRLNLSNILKIFATQQDSGLYSNQTFIDSFSSPGVTGNNEEIDVESFLNEIDDLTSIECSSEPFNL